MEPRKDGKEKPEPRQPHCTCGLEQREADDLCTERDCPWKRGGRG